MQRLLGNAVLWFGLGLLLLFGAVRISWAQPAGEALWVNVSVRLVVPTAAGWQLDSLFRQAFGEPTRGHERLAAILHPDHGQPLDTFPLPAQDAAYQVTTHSLMTRLAERLRVETFSARALTPETPFASLAQHPVRPFLRGHQPVVTVPQG